MKIRISLLAACLAIVGITKPIDAEIINKTSLPQVSTRAKDLETVLQKSGLCKHYPDVVKILNDNTAIIATYADRRLSDKESKLLALNMAKLISTNVNKIAEVKVKLYDPASTKYWKDIVLSTAEIENGLKPGPEQEQTLNSIKILNNYGLVEGPNLESRIEVYKHILQLKHDGVQVQPYLSKLSQIEAAEKNKKNITAQLSELNTLLTEADSTVNKPISSSPSSNEIINSLQQSWQEASDREASALQAVEEAEQEQKAVNIPEAYDMDAQARYDNDCEELQKKVNAALAAWYQASHERDLAYHQLLKAKEQSL